MPSSLDRLSPRQAFLFGACGATVVLLLLSALNSSPNAGAAVSSSQPKHSTAMAVSGDCPACKEPAAVDGVGWRNPIPLLPILYTREDFGKLCEDLGLKTGVEIGVQSGYMAEVTLKKWKSCKMYLLIDVWAHQKTYLDVANVDDAGHNALFAHTKSRMAPFGDIVKYSRNYSSDAVHGIADNSIDYIYVDARHDYDGVMEDLVLYWPKLRYGGIMAGHDFLDVAEVAALSKQDWGLNSAGVRQPNGLAVRGAAEEFARMVQRQLVVTTRDAPWASFYMRK